jgi:GT2 family glycosyltransferase
MNNPLVTVNILSYNRKDELRNTLTKVYEQDYNNIEVIVVDNASIDGSPEMVETEFPDVKLIKLKKNIGIAGWNKGFEEAKGEYVLVLDDDSYPENGTICAGVKLLKNDNSIAVVGFTVFNYFFQIIENKEDYNKSQGKIIKTVGFIGCGALINTRTFLQLKGFDESIFLYYNEIEFSIRAIDAGYKILFDPHHKVIHSYSHNGRGQMNLERLIINKRRFEHTFRSYYLFLFYNFSIIYFIKYLIKLILSKFYVAIKLRYLFSFTKILFSLPFITIKVRHKRKPKKIITQQMYKYGNLKFKDLYVYY